MATFIAEHFIEIIFGLISAGLLAFCKHIYGKMQTYKKLAEEERNDQLDDQIEDHIEPIRQEIEDLRTYIRKTEKLEQDNMALILASYRFRLIQLCKAYINKGFMTSNEYEQLTEFFKVYSGLGGNGQAQQYYERAIKLPIHEENQKEEKNSEK